VDYDLLLRVLAAVGGAYLVAIWLGLAVWAFQDIASRTRDRVVQALVALTVIAFFLPGLLLYVMLRPRETLAERYERSLEEEALMQDLNKQQACPRCGYHIEQDYLYCPSCQGLLKQRCAKCGQPLALFWRGCPYCGEPIETEAAAAVYPMK
jgi:RNA polymerase subunit RPABC4/transcription elongation factor Spt4